jgi:uncharacterized protein YjbI with pentapeptide repeats
MKAKEVLKRYANGERNFQRADLRGQSFKGEDLFEADFSGADIRGANFTDATLRGVNFTGARAGVRKRWVIAQLITLGLIAALSGLLAGYFGAWCAIFFSRFYTDIYGYVPCITLIVISLVSLSIIARQGYTRRSIETVGFAVTFAVAVAFAITSVLAVTAASAVTGAFAGIVAGTFEGAATVAFASIVAFIFAFAAVGAYTPTGAVIMVAIFAIVSTLMAMIAAAFGKTAIVGIVAVTAFSIYVAWRTHEEDERFALIRTFSLRFAAMGGTKFCGADLSGSTFSGAALKSANFTSSRQQPTLLTHVCWKDAKQLHRAKVDGTPLANRAVRELLSTHNGYRKVYTRADLQGAYLVGANLNGANLKWADLHEANLQQADLRGANLTEVLATDADFTGAYLTGACLQNWNIDKNTKLEAIDCQFVFLQEEPNIVGIRDRYPASSDQVLEPGDFEQLIRGNAYLF